MSITIKEAKLTEEFGIIEKMRDESDSAADNYRMLASYTGTSDGAQLFIMLKGKSMRDHPDYHNNAKLVKIASTTKISSNKTNLYHANDCTYASEHYYVCTKKDNKKDIYVFDKTDLNKTGVYLYTGTTLKIVTGIAYLGNDYFILEQGTKIAVCQKKGDTFVEKRNFTLSGEKPTGDSEATINGVTGLIRQGICANNGYLYKVYGKEATAHITKNYIVKWMLTGPAPEYTGCTLVDMYKCSGGDSGIDSSTGLFEIEGISMVSNQMYAAARIAKDEDSLFKAKLYKVAL